MTRSLPWSARGALTTILAATVALAAAGRRAEAEAPEAGATALRRYLEAFALEIGRAHV